MGREPDWPIPTRIRGEAMADTAARFEVSRGWLHKHIYPILDKSLAPENPNSPPHGLADANQTEMPEKW